MYKSKIGKLIGAIFAMGALAATAIAVSAHGNLVGARHLRAATPPFPAQAVVNGTGVWTPAGWKQVQFAPLSVATGSHTQVIAAVAGKTIAVISVRMTNTVAAGTAAWETSTSNVVLGTYVMAANGLIDMRNQNGTPYFVTGVGDSLNLTVTGTSNVVSGDVEYVTY